MTTPAVHRYIITNALKNLAAFRREVILVMVDGHDLMTVPVVNIPRGLLDLMLDRLGETILYFSPQGLTIALELIHKFVRFEAELIEASDEPDKTETDKGETDPLEYDGDHTGQPLPPAPATLPASGPTPPAKSPRKPRGTHRLVDLQKIAPGVVEAKKQCEGIRKDQKDQFRLTLLTALENRPERLLLLAKPKHLEILESLRADFPNFSMVLDWLKVRLQLQIAIHGPVSWPPILLAGLPGVGKTEFARAFSERMAFEYACISIAATSSTFSLRGSHRTWHSATVGVIAEKICALPDRKGLVVLLDEVDKIQDYGKNYPVEPVLLELLEPAQSDHFEDEYLGVPLNITPMVTWFATANDLKKVSSPLQSRLQVFEIPLPNKEQMPAIVRSVDRGLRAKQPGLARVFEPLDEAVVDMFRSSSPRELRGAMEQCYGIALQGQAVSGKRRVRKEDVRQAMLSLPAPVSRHDEGGEDDKPWLLVIPGRRSGGGTPPTNTYH